MYELEVDNNITYSVYIIKRKSRNTGVISYYTGMTNNIYRRFKEHKNGKTKANKGYIVLGFYPVSVGISTMKLAMGIERLIKNYNQKEKIELIQNFRLVE